MRDETLAAIAEYADDREDVLAVVRRLLCAASFANAAEGHEELRDRLVERASWCLELAL